MVITKALQIKSAKKLKQGLDYIDDKEKISDVFLKNENNLNEKINYIVDVNKTIIDSEYNAEDYSADFYVDADGNKELVSVYGLSSAEYAYDEMMLTKEQARFMNGEQRGKQVNVLAHHIIQSFSPDDNLTPEEVHEIGRKTILELTGGEHEFVIATHMDKDHLHNHIIFNTTNNVTMKKFRWQKGTKRSLEKISDKHADLAGAKIIEKDKIIDHKKYEAYKKQNTFRYQLKEKLNFLIKNSNSVEDFLAKANRLNVEIDTSKKELRYRLKDSKQERFVRDRTLSKKGYYSKENIEKLVNKNTKKVSVEDIEKIFREYQKEKNDDFEMRFTVEDWQVLKETNRGIYLEVEFGLASKGDIFIPHEKIDRLENGNYELFIKRNDYFYFINEKNATENRFIKGATLAKQLSHDSGEFVVYKNPQVYKIDSIREEFKFLAENNVKDYESYREFHQKLVETVEKTQSELERLDSKIVELNKVHSALLARGHGDRTQEKIASNILEKFKIPQSTNKKEIERLIKEATIERDILNEKFSDTIGKYKQSKNIEQNIELRKNRWNLMSSVNKKENR